MTSQLPGINGTPPIPRSSPNWLYPWAPRYSSSAQRLAGYLGALKRHGLRKMPASLPRATLVRIRKGLRRRLLKRKHRPTAIFASNDEMPQVLYVARELGLNVPEDLSIVGFDDSMVAERTRPPLTTVRQPVTAMADAITRSLIKSLRGHPVAARDQERHYDCELSFAPLLASHLANEEGNVGVGRAALACGVAKKSIGAPGEGRRCLHSPFPQILHHPGISGGTASRSPPWDCDWLSGFTAQRQISASPSGSFTRMRAW